MAVKAKVFDFALGMDEAGEFSIDGATAALDERWTPEHLVLGGLARCSVASLRHFAQQRNISVDASASASGQVTRRDDGRYGFVEIRVEVDARIEPLPESLDELLDKAEWGCFIGASLQPKPVYRWLVNGEQVR